MKVKKLVKNDSDHIYKMEDKGSCIVRMRKEDYEKNVESHLDNPQMYEKLDDDPTDETKEKVVDFVDEAVRDI